MTKNELFAVFAGAGIDAGSYVRILDFLLYYGVLGVRIGDQEHFIYGENYDLRMLKIRAERAHGETLYLLNPAFWPTFGIDEATIARTQAEAG